MLPQRRYRNDYSKDEQYVYYDPSKGDLSEVLVAPGTQVEVGTPLIRYDATELQSALDTAVRGRDKIGRQIEDLRTNGQTVQTTGDAETDLCGNCYCTTFSRYAVGRLE